MLLSYLALAFSVSIDSLGIGITYGLRNTKITHFPKVILFTISVLITSIGVLIGNILNKTLPIFLTNALGTLILIFMGIWIIFQTQKNEDNKLLKKETKKKIYNFFINSLGITIRIIKDPISSDLDGSKHIDIKEALYLGIALSLDSLCVGIGSSTLGFSSFLFPFMVAIFQFIFLFLGRILGNRISNISKIPNNIWSIISGILLILIGILKVIL